MTLHAPSAARVAVAVGIGIAGCLYAIHALQLFAAGGLRPGVWDLTASVITDPHMTGPVLWTAVLVRAVIRPNPIAPQTLRLGTYRSLLLAETRSAAADVVLPGIALLIGCWCVALAAGVPWRLLELPGSAISSFTAAGLPWPLGLVVQLALVSATLTVAQMMLGALRIVAGSGIPGVGLAFILWGWMGVSVEDLTLTISPGQSQAGIADGLAQSASPALNSGAYLDDVITLQGHALIPVLSVLILCTLLCVSAAHVMDLRVRHSRRRVNPKPIWLLPVGAPSAFETQRPHDRGEHS